MLIYTRLRITVLFCVVATLVSAQDEFFTSYRTAPLVVNPAEAGRIDSKSRLTVLSRTQWNSITDNSYRSLFAGWEAQIGCIDDGFFGLALSGSAEQSGASNFRRVNGQVALSYHQRIGTDLYLAAGGEVGVLNYALAADQLQFDAQYDGVNFIPTAPTGENFARFSQIRPDAAVGVVVYDARGDFAGGISFDHLLSPSLSFLEEGGENLPIGMTIYGNAQVQLGQNSTERMGVHGLWRRYAIFVNRQWHGLFGVYGMLPYGSRRGNASFLRNYVRVGISARIGGNEVPTSNLLADAILANLTVAFKGTQFGFTYDWNISRLTLASGGFGGVELFFSAPLGGEKGCVICPKF